MPIRIFHVEGAKEIDQLDEKINDWMDELKGRFTVKQIHTAMSETAESGPTLVVTVWYEDSSN
jgi:hypothetical protein